MMRVTLGEIYYGQAAVVMGAVQLGEGKANVRGYPVPVWTSYILIFAGLLIPLLAWYLRRPVQNSEAHKLSHDKLLSMCCSQLNTSDGDADNADGKQSPCTADQANCDNLLRLPRRDKHVAIERHMMRVTLAEICWGHLFVFCGALQLGADAANMRDYPVPLWTAYIILAAGLFLPLLAWYLRRPVQKIKTYRH